MPEALLRLALSETVDYVLEPLGQGLVPKRLVHRLKPLSKMIAIRATEACCLGLSHRVGQRWRDPV